MEDTPTMLMQEFILISCSRIVVGSLSCKVTYSVA